MKHDPEVLRRLIEQAEVLETKQKVLQQEIAGLRSRIEGLAQAVPEPAAEAAAGHEAAVPAPPEIPAPAAPLKKTVKKPKIDLEKFIGENLINKVGIAVTVIGVGIGARYAIDHDLISPLTRIILGYLAGLVLLGFAIRLKKRYHNFSAVLLSGSMAILYFITFAAWNFYSLIPPAPAFALMTLFTVFTVAAAIFYNRQVIAHIGLVGAYAVPFLLDDGTGRVIVLFAFVALVNLGILAIAFLKYWKPLYYSSFVLTWLIFYTWYIPGYSAGRHFALSMAFISVYFVTFYIIALAYKLIRKEKPEAEELLILVANSGIFYGLGYATLHSDPAGNEWRGLFTLVNALVQFAVTALALRRKTGDPVLPSWVAGLGIVFITIAIPVQFNGHWITVSWCAEAVVLFWLGRKKRIAVCELLSCGVMVVAFFALVRDWQTFYRVAGPGKEGEAFAPFLNLHFLTSAAVAAGIGFIQYYNRHTSMLSPLSGQKRLLKVINAAIPAILLFVLFFSVIKEISFYWRQLFEGSLLVIDRELTVPREIRNGDLLQYGNLASFAWSMLFFSALSFANLKWFRNGVLGYVNLIVNAMIILLFLTVGWLTLGDLRESYITGDLSEYYYRGWYGIGVRYILFLFAALLVYSTYRYVRARFPGIDLRMEFDFLFHITVLASLANELINWMDLYRPGQSYKLGLSILFGVYALFLVIIGIRKKKAYLRYSAMVLVGATLLKLFFYDLASLDTISRTIVFVILGAVLLVISFLYNRYKAVIYDEKRDA